MCGRKDGCCARGETRPGALCGMAGAPGDPRRREARGEETREERRGQYPSSYPREKALDARGRNRDRKVSVPPKGHGWAESGEASFIAVVSSTPGGPDPFAQRRATMASRDQSPTRPNHRGGMMMLEVTWAPVDGDASCHGKPFGDFVSDGDDDDDDDEVAAAATRSLSCPSCQVKASIVRLRTRSGDGRASSSLCHPCH